VLKLNQVELLGVTTFGPEGLDRENLGGLMRGTRERQE
jgi:hypothetical protein